MKVLKNVYKLLLITLFVFPVVVSAKKPLTPPDASANFSGIIVDKLTQEELGGVYLYFEELQKGVYSSPDGTFNFEGIVPGDYKVTLQYISYHEKKLSVRIKKSNHHFKTIQLEPVLP